MHRSALLLAFVVGSLGLSACGRAPEGAEATPAPDKVQRATATPLKPLAQKKFGGEITESTNTNLEVLFRDGPKFQSKVVRTEGVVSAVCKSMGCWMEIADPTGKAHIKMAGHSFFVPKDASGHRAVVQGTVIKATTEQVKASDEECLQEAKAQTGAIAKIEIEATAVQFVD